MAKKKILNIAGKTTDGKDVTSGNFSLVGSHGLPLELVLMFMKEKELVIDWLDYINGALKDGANIETVKARISSAVADVYGPKYRDEVMKRIEFFFPAE